MARFLHRQRSHWHRSTWQHIFTATHTTSTHPHSIPLAAIMHRYALQDPAHRPRSTTFALTADATMAQGLPAGTHHAALRWHQATAALANEAAALALLLAPSTARGLHVPAILLQGYMGLMEGDDGLNVPFLNTTVRRTPTKPGQRASLRDAANKAFA